MLRHGKRCSRIGIGLILVLLQGLAAGTAMAQPANPPNVFFSQGQAVYNAQEPSKSQREALHDFQLQAITQAASVILSPAQIGKQYQQIQEKILRQPQRYVQTYRIISESPATGGLYRIAGQVTISLDLLKKDLLALPPAPPEREPSPPSGQPSRDERPASDVVGDKGGQTGEVPGRGSASKQEVLWAVAEKWEQGWHLPGGQRDPKGPFAASVFQELQDYGWSLRFPQAGTLVPNNEGEVAASQALAQASSLELRQVVVGNVVLGENEEGETRIGATLRLLNAVSGKGQGEIHKELVTGEATSHEAAIELAAFVVPQLDRQLRAAPGSVTAAGGPAQPEEAGELVLQIQSSDAYADWLALERTLREHSPNLQVKGLEIGPAGSLVRLQEVDALSLKNLHGTRLANGARVEVTSLGAEGQAFRITLTRSEMGSAEPKP
jgi:hypothetical protein